MSARALSVTMTPGKYALLKGDLHDWLIEHHVSAVYSRTQRGWNVRHDRLPDVLAMAQHDGLSVYYRPVKS